MGTAWRTARRRGSCGSSGPCLRPARYSRSSSNRVGGGEEEEGTGGEVGAEEEGEEGIVVDEAEAGGGGKEEENGVQKKQKGRHNHTLHAAPRSGFDPWVRLARVGSGEETPKPKIFLGVSPHPKCMPLVPPLAPRVGMALWWSAWACLTCTAACPHPHPTHPRGSFPQRVGGVALGVAHTGPNRSPMPATASVLIPFQPDTTTPPLLWRTPASPTWPGWRGVGPWFPPPTAQKCTSPLAAPQNEVSPPYARPHSKPPPTHAHPPTRTDKREPTKATPIMKTLLAAAVAILLSSSTPTHAMHSPMFQYLETTRHGEPGQQRATPALEGRSSGWWWRRRRTCVCVCGGGIPYSAAAVPSTQSSSVSRKLTHPPTHLPNPYSPSVRAVRPKQGHGDRLGGGTFSCLVLSCLTHTRKGTS